MKRWSAGLGLLVSLVLAVDGAFGLFAGQFYGFRSRRQLTGPPARIIGGLVLLLAIWGAWTALREFLGPPSGQPSDSAAVPPEPPPAS